MSLPKYTDRQHAATLLEALGEEFTVIENPGYVHPRYELCPLAPRLERLEGGLDAIVMDMDGTTTTTETLCLHSLETMTQRMTGNAENPAWPGLDHERDYPHIIGNSTTRHVEYLVKTYRDGIDDRATRRHFIEAAAWTLAHSGDEGRKADVRAALQAFDAGDVVDDARFQAIMAGARGDLPELAEDYRDRLTFPGADALVRAGIVIYYQRYHVLLSAIGAGDTRTVSRALEGVKGPLIRPMPGVGLFLALVKGWLADEDAAAWTGYLAERWPEGGGDGESRRALGKKLARRFEEAPAKVAIVTSSIRYEADIVLRSVFEELRKEIAEWPVSETAKERIRARFASPETYYDGVITATDSSEIRLKPHRDLYSLALHQLGVDPGRFGRVAGFEDSESGVTAIRAAGIGLCCAVPFAETAGHQLDGASHICPGGLPEVILKHGLFLGDAEGR